MINVTIYCRDGQHDTHHQRLSSEVMKDKHWFGHYERTGKKTGNKEAYERACEALGYTFLRFESLTNSVFVMV